MRVQKTLMCGLHRNHEEDQEVRTMEGALGVRKRQRGRRAALEEEAHEGQLLRGWTGALQGTDLAHRPYA